MPIKIKSLAIYSLLFWVFINFVNAQSPQNYSPLFEINSEEEFDLTQFTQIYNDKEGINEVLEVLDKDFVPMSSNKLSLEVNYYWVRLELKSNLENATEWKLKLFDDWCEKVNVYSSSLSNSDKWFKQKAGFATSIEQLDVNPSIQDNTRKVPNEVSLLLNPSEHKIVYIRYVRKNRQQLSITPSMSPVLVAANRLIDYDRKSFLVIVFMSMVFMLALYHFMGFIFNKDRAYLYYMLYGFSAIMSSTIMDEYGLMNYHIFYRNYPNIQPWIFLLTGLVSVIVYTLFTRSYLETKNRFPKLDLILRVLIIWTIAIGIIVSINFALTGRQYLTWMPFSVFVLIISAAYTAIFIIIWREKKVTDIFYLLGVGLLIVVMLPIHLYNLFDWSFLKGYQTMFKPLGATQIGILLELIMFSLGLSYRSRKIQKEKQRLEELDQIKSNLFTNISHEFRTPLTLIIGPLKELISRTEDGSKDKKVIEMAHKNASRLLQLINQVLDISKLEAKQMDITVSKQNFTILLKGVVMSFESLASRNNVRLQFISQNEDIPIYADWDKIEKIFYNLLSNAFKFTPDKGEVSVMIIEHNNDIEVIVKDNGIGIEPSKLPQIFNRFFQSDESQKIKGQGSGIGLAIVKELVELHKGKIKVKSEVDKGSSFSITLRKGKSHFKVKQIASKEVFENNDIDDAQVKKSVFEDNYIAPVPEFPLNMDGRERILIIEDHSDVRAYIKQHLQDAFVIFEAENGEDGVNKALKFLPDLIISDVMMPKKNGYDVCHILKNDERSSHIPIILLTAKAASNEKIKGLETGADDYLVKPFDSKELEVRVKNLIKSRTELRKKYSNTSFFEPLLEETNNIDKIFLQKVISIINENLESDQLGVDYLAREIGMSKGHLNRKLKAIVDQSTNKMIQNIRLQRAYDMLVRKSGNVSEIALKSGFSSNAYFVKCFKDKYGKTPGTLLQEYM